ncbi:armadillo repeat-containing protein 5 [Ambystoma mexicanum]|uniref:armadillo repeat-containing protein 5 n=1 Tax=Ambystoma mexicanum TaxID=8296 RepID=UPI0037E83C36
MASRESAGESLVATLAKLAGPDPAAQARALYVIRTRHIKQPGGIESFRAHGGLEKLLALLRNPRARRWMDLGLSILANCCTERGSRAKVRQVGGIPPLVTILKSLNVDSILNRTARALGNLALEPESCHVIHESGALPHLVDVLKTSQDGECLQSVIRALRNLADTPSHRLSIAQHGAIPPMVERLASTDVALVAACVRALSDLTKGCSLDCAEQLSLSDGVTKLVALAGHSTKSIHECTLLTLGNLCLQGVVRPTVGNAGGIRCLVDEMKGQSDVSLLYIRALCLCCREAINRVRVREAGGLELLLTLAKDGRYPQAHPRIIASFLNFFYDEVALEYLQANGLVPLLVSRLEALTESHPRQVSEEEEGEDERYAASYDFPTEYNRRPDPEQQQAAESSSFQSLRSWLLSEGYIASPGELSPERSPDSGNSDLDPQYMEGSVSPTLGLQYDASGASEELSRMDPLDPASEETRFSIGDQAAVIAVDQGLETKTDAPSRSPRTQEDTGLVLCSPAAGVPGRPLPGEQTSGRDLDAKMSSTFCLRRRSKSRSIQGTGDCFPNFSEASTSTPLRPRCEDRKTSLLDGGEHLVTPLQEILQASETLSSSFYRQEEVWGPEAPLLLLLSRFSQVVDPSNTLVTDATLQGLLSYVARSSEPSHRCLRLLHRLTCNPNCLEAFIRTYGAALIRSQLILGLSPKVITTSLTDPDGEESMDPVQGNNRRPQECWRVTRMKELGETLLRNLSVQAESPFGIGTLNHLILTGSETDKAACAMALPLICRKEALMRKLLVEAGGLALILDKLLTSFDPLFVFTAADALVTLATVFSPDSELQEGRKTPHILPLSRPLVKRARLDEPNTESTLATTCPYQRLMATGQTDLHFRLDCGGMVGAVRQQLLSSSDFFQAMLGGEYLESRQDVVPIHGISLAVFNILMHFLHGCHEGEPCLVLEGVREAMPDQGFESSVLGHALSAASQYLLPGLQSLLEDFVCELLQLRILPSVYCFCELYQNRSLQQRCLRFLLHSSHQPLARGRCLSRLVLTVTDQRALVEGLHSVVLGVL